MFIQLKNIIGDTECNIEFKNRVDFNNPQNYIDVITNLANKHKTGYVIFGVDDTARKILGINEVKKSYINIMNNMKTMIKPKIRFIIEIVNIENKNIILVKILPENDIVYSFSNKK